MAFAHRDGKVCYFNGHLPVFIHESKDLATFRLFSSQLVINGNATQAQISRAFGVPLVTPANTLTVRLHHLSANVHDEVITHLCNQLTATEAIFPRASLRLIFQFVGSS
ncbi:MAG TPA: hypothetical protein VIS74_06310 [Chthoniobacterales bacterium]